MSIHIRRDSGDEKGKEVGDLGREEKDRGREM